MSQASVVAVGDRFGRLVIEDRDGSLGGNRAWRCRCDCGGSVRVPTSRLRRGKTRSCGCLKAERTREMGRKTRHGQTDTPTWVSWKAMRDRCTYSTHPAWGEYGGRGITVCERWQLFENFLADMGERPEGKTLDRLDPDGNYEPGNCRWATWEEQNARGHHRHTGSAI